MILKIKHMGKKHLIDRYEAPRISEVKDGFELMSLNGKVKAFVNISGVDHEQRIYIMENGNTTDSMRIHPLAAGQGEGEVDEVSLYIREMFSGMGIYEAVDLIAKILSEDGYSLEMSTSKGLVYPEPQNEPTPGENDDK